MTTIQKTKYLTNYPYFKGILASNYKMAIENFKNAIIDTEHPNDIIEPYDDCGGFCTFKFVSSTDYNEYWEFIGTAK